MFFFPIKNNYFFNRFIIFSLNQSKSLMSCWDLWDKMEPSKTSHRELEGISLSPRLSKDTCQGPLCCVQSIITTARHNSGHWVKWSFQKQLMNSMGTGLVRRSARMLLRACHFNLGTMTSWQIWLLADSSFNFRGCQPFKSQMMLMVGGR